MSKLAHSSDEETMNEIERASRTADGDTDIPAAAHSVEDQFQHFLSYTCAVTDPIERLRLAYTHGVELGSLTARDEGIEAAIQAVYNAGGDNTDYHIARIRELKGASHD